MFRVLASLHLAALLVAVCVAHPGRLLADDSVGQLPRAADGRALNLDLETGDLTDWTAQGDAFAGQPISGDTVAARRPDANSQHDGRYWVGSYERAGDAPQGYLTSAPFKLTERYVSFLVGGGADQANVRVELVRKTGDVEEVIAQAAGETHENMSRVLFDLEKHVGQEIFVRLVDRSSAGWGHINFDDLRLHAAKPSVPLRTVQPADQFTHAGLDPKQAAQAMTVPEGFRVTLYAGEPDVVQPIAQCIDDRGRLWVAEDYSYPFRVPAEQARDRILIFEDTDGDGTHDKRTVFAEKLNLVSGLELGFGGVWVGAAPELLFIPDNNADDVPDGPPQVVLDGWGLQDTHETLNSFTWGPDGWLYGCHGVFTHSAVGKPGTPKDERTAINAGIWRYHPVQKKFEVFAHGTSNPWGVDFDDRGQAFLTACVIPHLYHIIPGGRYQRQAGGHFNRHTYEDIKTIADHVHWLGTTPHGGNNRSDAAGGGHAHAGCMIYLGDSWPAEYRGRLLMNNIHGARINSDQLQPQGSGFVGRHGPDFLLANDSWSQILNLQYGPAGEVYLLDWYDKNQCHRLEKEVHDRTNGRVFCVRFGGPRKVKVNLAQATAAELVQHQLHANDWFVRHARRLLQERGADADTIAALEKIAFEHADETRRLRGLWSLHAVAALDTPRLLRGLGDQSPYVRGWCIQLACQNGPPESSLLARFQELATRDPSPVVRLYLASALGRLPIEPRWDILGPLVQHGGDANDHNLPLMYWYALEPLTATDADRALALAQQSAVPKLLAFAVRRVASEGTDEALRLLIGRLDAERDAAGRQTILGGVSTALKGRRDFKPPENWAAVAEKLRATGGAEIRLAVDLLGVTFGERAAIDSCHRLVNDATAEAGARRQALEALVATRQPKLVAELENLLDDKALQREAIRALAAFDAPDAAGWLLNRYGRLAGEARRDAINSLAARAGTAEALLAAVAEKQIAATDLTADVVRQIRNLKSDKLTEQVTKLWGVVRDSPKDKAEQIERYARLLRSKAPPAPDVRLGRAVFAKTCQQCHKLFDAGGAVGPELTGSNRIDPGYVLSNVLDPSAVMAKEYFPTVLGLADGRVITGIVRAEDDQTLTVLTANETLTIAKGDVEERQQAEKSMMPDDLLKPLGDHEVRSLAAYLASPAQVPLPDGFQTEPAAGK